MTQRRTNPIEGLRNTRRSMGDGTLSGRSRIATPHNPRRLRRPTSAVSGAQIPVGEQLVMVGSVTVAGGGSSVLTQLDTIQAQSGFSASLAASDPVVIPFSALWLAEIYIRFTDGYRGGATVQLTRGGTAVPETWPSWPRPWGEWADQVGFGASKQDVIEVLVTPTDGLAHPAEMTFRLGTMERLRVTATTPPVTGDIYFNSFDGVWVYNLADETATNLGEPLTGTNSNPYAGAFGYQSGAVTICVTGYDGNIMRASQQYPGPDDWVEVVSDAAAVAVNPEHVRFEYIDTDNAGTWVAVTGCSDGQSEIWRSTDDGETWTRVQQLTNSLNRVRYDRVGTWHVYSHDLNGVPTYWSTDGGATWTGIDWSTLGVPDNISGGGVAQGHLAVGHAPRFGGWEAYESAPPLTAWTGAYGFPANIYGTQSIGRSPDGTRFLGWGGTNLGPVGFGYWIPGSYNGDPDASADGYALVMANAPAVEFIPSEDLWHTNGEIIIISGVDAAAGFAAGFAISTDVTDSNSWQWFPRNWGGAYDVYGYQPF